MKIKALFYLMSAYVAFTTFNVMAAETTFQQFYQQQNEAYAGYRTALFQTNNENQSASLKEIAAFNTQWHQIIQQFADNPPEIFATDSEWKPTLIKVANIASQATEQIKSGNLTEAHETLEAIRDELSDLRSRNYLTFFSDRINSYHEVMEHLLVKGYNRDSIDANTIRNIYEQLAVLEYLAEEISVHVPDKYRSDDTYLKLQKGLVDSLKKLRGALNSGDTDTIAQAIKALKPAYSKLFVNFG